MKKYLTYFVLPRTQWGYGYKYVAVVRWFDGKELQSNRSPDFQEEHKAWEWIKEQLIKEETNT